jgi:pyrroline-5-carboxylate reductase
MKIGFLGAGAITSAMVTGLKAGGRLDSSILLSPRNANVAAALADRFVGVAVAGSNQQVLDDSETVVIAVRPQVAAEVLGALRFRADHNVISLVSGLNVEKLSKLIAPATRVARAVPLPSAANGLSPTAIYPADLTAETIFSQLGAAFAVDSELKFDVLCCATATMATYFGFASGIADWLTNHGIPPEESRDYVGRLFAGMSYTTTQKPGHSFDSLAADHATKGGTNEQVLRHLRDNNVFRHLDEAMDGILRRVTGK